MMTVYLGPRAFNQLNHDSIYDTTKYRYFMEEDSVRCLHREYLDTAGALSNKAVATRTAGNGS